MLSGQSACSGGRLKSGVYVRTGGTESQWKPRQIVLLYPAVATNAVETRDVSTGTRPLMGSEMIAVVHVNVRKHLGTPGPTSWKDASEPGVSRERLALLGTVIQREYNQKGVVPVRILGELYRASGSDAALLVNVFKYGPSGRMLESRGVAGQVRQAGAASSPGWMNCGVKVTLFNAAQGKVAWEGSYLDSLPAGTAPSQEEMVKDCVAKIMEAFPYRK
jgi:hypothetical protein